MNFDALSQYELLKQENISDISSQGYILRHKKTGARVCLVENKDINKVFYIGFRTTPQDSTGVPHIIEHTVLCGSDKFPVKDPFIELAKGSLNTFLNAMTYPDKTIYPVASCNDQDFRNLMDVYLDAVFHPNITKYEEIFKQEGWHYELDSVDAPLVINGVVYNEMKGAYSSPDEILRDRIFESLFPDNTYSKDSGGNPLNIPELTYEAYLDFYHKYYHPSNSYIFLYGDVDFEEKLNWIDEEYLSKYDYLKVDSEVAEQKAFDEIKDFCSEYSISSDDSVEDKTSLSYNRVIGDSLDKMLYQALDILDYALVSSPGAPVKTALIEAGIGEDVYGSYEPGVKQPVFSIIAKNTNASEKERFVQIIEDVFREQISNGINKEALIAGINSSEFRFREADFGQFPKGLLYGLQCLDSWLFDDMAPFIHLQCLDTFAELKRLVETDYFEQLLQKHFLDNTHGSIVVVAPRPGLNQEEDAKLKAKLDEYKSSLSAEEIDTLVEQTRLLKEYQETPSPEEDLRSLPMLSRSDLKKEAMPFTNIEDDIESLKVVKHNVESNGIHYISVMFNIDDIPVSDFGYLGILSTILGYVDTKSYSYAALSNAINIYTGGISGSLTANPNLREPGEIITSYEFKIKVLQDNLEKAMDLLDEIIRTSKLDDTKRIGEIISQTKSRLQLGLSSAGNTVSAMRSLSHFSKYALFQDEIRGVNFYRTVCEAEKLLHENPDALVAKLKALNNKIFAQNRILISYTANEDCYKFAAPIIGKYLSKLNPQSPIGKSAEYTFEKKNEGFTDPSQILYVTRTGDFRKAGFEYSGALKLLKIILSYDYLWINVRVLGGAYGCGASSLRTGEMFFSSYRDPNLEKTNEVYEKIPEYLRAFDPDERDMTKYIIGTFSALDTPLNPEAEGSRSMSAYIQGVTFEQVQRERDEILNASQADIRALADLIEAVLEQNNLCVVGNEDMINEASAMFDSIEKLCN